MDLIKLYQDFMREVIDKKYLNKFEDVIVLAENFIGSDYIVIFEVEEEKKSRCVEIKDLDIS